MRVDEATGQLAEELGRFPSAAQVADRIGATTEQVLEAMEAAHARRTLSLDMPRPGEGDTSPTVELIGSKERGYDRVEADLAAAGADLDEREWRVLRMRFVDERTQQEIGSMMGVSQMQISRVSRRALWKLLSAVRGEEREDGPPASMTRAGVDPIREAA